MFRYHATRVCCACVVLCCACVVLVLCCVVLCCVLVLCCACVVLCVVCVLCVCVCVCCLSGLILGRAFAFFVFPCAPFPCNSSSPCWFAFPPSSQEAGRVLVSLLGKLRLHARKDVDLSAVVPALVDAAVQTT